jgi:hypothetical protein
MLRAIAIDDERAALYQLKKIAKPNDNVDLIAGFTDPLWTIWPA